MTDTVIKAATIVDGTGAPAFRGDIGITDGIITQVGGTIGGERVIDADGLHALPGFVDIHTHYDAQLHFEPSASPSSWHGVTTVLTGNCGFAIAPSKPADVDWLVQMLAKVEGMSPDALRAGVPWAGGSLGEFLDGLEGRIGVNMATYAGHAAIRRWVMGADASERAATEAEIAAMCEVMDAAMRDGAIGLSTSQLDVHADHEGKPVPPNLATPAEIVALASVMARYPAGAAMHLCRSFATGYDASDRKLLADIARASGGKPVHVNILLRFTGDPDRWRTCLDVLEGYAAEGLRVYPMASANPKGLYVSLADTILLSEIPTFRTTLALEIPERIVALRDPAVRDALRREFAEPRQLAFGWENLRIVASPTRPDWEDRTVAEVAAGADGMDTFLDLATADELRTLFLIDRPVSAEDREVISFLLRHPLTMPGSSDGGAHLNTFCGADYTTRILTEYVDDSFTFEQAVRRLSAIPAQSVGLWDRGELRPGAAADIVLVDRDRLAVGAARMVHDFPTGAMRVIWEQQGYVATMVNGEVLIDDGTFTGNLPGEVIRFNR